MLSRLMKRIDKTFVLGVVLIGFAFAYACGQIPDAPDAESSVTITAPDGYAVSCAANYTRKAPHFCQLNADAASNQAGMTSDNTCRSINVQSAFTNPPSTSATALAVVVLWSVNANNAIAYRQTNITLATAATCATNHFVGAFGVREFAAVLAGSVIGQGASAVVVTPISANLIYYVSNDAGTTSTPANLLRVAGYYD